MALRAISLWLLAGLALASPLRAENFALLIGVSGYPALRERDRLAGPANDVDLVARYLTEVAPVPFDPRNITVLSDATPGAPPATLAAIRTAFADLAARVGPGDFVYLHMSGHGSQAPALNDTTEPDGLDELFLPYDIGPWQPGTGDVVNALRDDEMSVLIGAVLARGADVWAVFDSCHSGSVTRGPGGDGGEGLHERRIDPAVLGIPAVAARVAPPAPPFELPAAAPGAGNLTAFFAAQTTQTTPELNLPPGQPGRRVQGVFTFTLIEALASHPGITYRQLAQQVLHSYASQALTPATPVFDGALDRPVFGAGPAASVRQWPLVRNGNAASTIPAGALHGLRAGDRLQVMAAPGDPDGAALGTMVLRDLTAFGASAQPVPPLTWAELPVAVWLRPTGRTLDFRVTLAAPDPADFPHAQLDAIMAALALAAPDLTARLHLRPHGAMADLRLLVRGGALGLAPGGGLPGSADPAAMQMIAAGAPDAMAADLAQAIGQAARARNLLRIAASLPADLPDLDVSLLLRRSPGAELTPIPDATVPRFHPDDEVWIALRNQGTTAVDVNVLHIGTDNAISHLFETRILPAEALTRGLFRVLPRDFGRERLVFALVPATAQGMTGSLRFLAEPETPAESRLRGADAAIAVPGEGFAGADMGAGGGADGAGDTGLTALLAAAGFSDPPHGIPRSGVDRADGLLQPAMRIVAFDTVPAGLDQPPNDDTAPGP